MAFKDLHKLKKIAEIEKEEIEINYLVLGNDIFSLEIFSQLETKYGTDKVRLLSEDKLIRHSLFVKGPSTIRGESNKKIFKHYFSSLECVDKNEPSLFFKDLTWKPFFGRSKSEALLHDEHYFTSGAISFDQESIFTFLTDEYLASVNERAYQVKVKSIDFENEYYIVECINGTIFKVRNLYFGKSPWQFVHLFKSKNKLNDQLIQACESTQASAAMFLKFCFSKPVTDEQNTLFIPLSYTHDHGHFIGEFKKFSQGGVNGSIVEFLHYIDVDQTSEEDVTKIIRQLKRSVEKIFDNIFKNNYQEFISIERDLGCLKIDDILFQGSLSLLSNEHRKMVFIGKNAPINVDQLAQFKVEDSDGKVSQFARAYHVNQVTMQNL